MGPVKIKRQILITEEIGKYQCTLNMDVSYPWKVTRGVGDGGCLAAGCTITITTIICENGVYNGG